MTLLIDTEWIDDQNRWEIKLTGEVDLMNAAQFRAALTASYDEFPADIRLDVSELNYIDSTGLGVILGAFGRMQEKKHRIFIDKPKAHVEKLLRVTTLDKIFQSEGLVK